MQIDRWLALAALALTVLASSCATSAQETRKMETAAMSNALETILQLTLDSGTLDKYFHVDALPERKPLRILANNMVPASAKLHKFGEAVVWVTPEQREALPVLEFTAVKIGEDSATVSFQYTPEGISGIVQFRKQGEQWEITGSHVTER